MAFITAVQYVYRIYVHTVNEQLGKSNTYIDYGKLSNTKRQQCWTKVIHQSEHRE